MRRIIMRLCLILVVVFLIVCVFFIFKRNYNYILVADFIFAKIDNNEMPKSRYEYAELLEICTDKRVNSIIKNNPNHFIDVYIMCKDEVAFKGKGVYVGGIGGMAVVRNDTIPLSYAEGYPLDEVVYKRISKRLYKWTNGLFPSMFMRIPFIK